MFRNIGRKMQAIAKAICWGGIIVSILYAIILWNQNTFYSNTIGTGFLVLSVGSVASLLSSFVLYALGQITDDLHALRIKHVGEPATDVESVPVQSTEEASELYQQALELQSDGKYREAIDILDRIAPFKDAEKRICTCWYHIAMDLLDRKEYDQAYDAFECAGTCQNAAAMLTETRYQQARHLYSLGKKEEAADLFCYLIRYKDTRSIVENDPELKLLIRNPNSSSDK